MTDKTMPERIWLQGDAEDLDDVSWGRELVWEDDVEYVRADLAQGDANEPLEAGQRRWARVTADQYWFIAFICNGLAQDTFCFEIGRSTLEQEDIEEVGPVIRPPEDV